VPHTIPARVRAALIAFVAVLALPAVAPSHASAGTSRFESRVIAEINAVRAQNGLAAVGQNGRLAGAAGRHASRLKRRGQLKHSSNRALARIAGGRAGEVLGWSSNRRASARSIVNGWMSSPPHRAVLLDGGFRGVGVGASRGRRGLFVTADFGSR
jgi:uncharacterized protein YkwD